MNAMKRYSHTSELTALRTRHRLSSLCNDLKLHQIWVKKG